MITINNNKLKSILKGQNGLKNVIEYNVRPLGPLDPRPIITIDPDYYRQYLLKYFNGAIGGRLAKLLTSINEDTRALDHEPDYSESLPRGEDILGNIWSIPILGPVIKEATKTLVSPTVLGRGIIRGITNK